MLSSQAPRENPAAIRTALVALVGRQLRPVLGGNSAATPEQIAAWLAPLPADRVIRCLRDQPEDTAEALAHALISDDAARHPNNAIEAIVDGEFRTRSLSARARLVAFTKVLRRLSQEQDGQVLAADLYREGYPSAEAQRLMPDALQVIALLDGTAQARRTDRRPAAERLYEAGERAASRVSANAAA